jgi:molybdopterin/thiamine biosynthesis adenylyltransferase
MANKFGHEESYRGKDLLKKLASRQIALCGAGALGSNLADMLCRQGVTKLRVIDFDRVEESNIGTQTYGVADVGALKVAALKNRLFRDTGVEIDAFSKKLDSSNIAKAFKGVDLVIDTFDNRESRQLVTHYCSGFDAIHGGMFESYGEVVWNGQYRVPKNPPPDAVDVCDYPLARNLVMFVVSIMSEEILDFCTAKVPRRSNWCITLKDLKIGSYR